MMLLPGREPRRVGEAWRSSIESRAMFVLGDEAECTFVCTSEAESTEGEGVRSWTFFCTLAFEDGEGFALEVDVVGEGGRGRVSGGACGFREKKPNTFIVFVCLCFAGSGVSTRCVSTRYVGKVCGCKKKI